ncbi:MAG: hypothetical protein U9N86_02405 [Bacteroidota bacterium]|nr:hypothetical protein [Bacteroidota bacterium]
MIRSTPLGSSVAVTADNLILSIFEIMERKKLYIKRTSLGGYERRTAKLTLDSGNTGGLSYE